MIHFSTTVRKLLHQIKMLNRDTQGESRETSDTLPWARPLLLARRATEVPWRKLLVCSQREALTIERLP